MIVEIDELDWHDVRRLIYGPRRLLGARFFDDVQHSGVLRNRHVEQNVASYTRDGNDRTDAYHIQDAVNVVVEGQWEWCATVALYAWLYGLRRGLRQLAPEVVDLLLAVGGARAVVVGPMAALFGTHLSSGFPTLAILRSHTSAVHEHTITTLYVSCMETV